MQLPTRLALAALLASSAFLPLAAHAQVTSFSTFRSQYYQQTGDPNVASNVTLNYADFSARMFAHNPGDVAAATLTYPGGPMAGKTLMQEPAIPVFGTAFDYSSGNLGTAAGVDAAYPAGDYTVNYSGGDLGSGSVTSTFSGTDAYSNVPAFTLAGYNALQNLDSTQSQTLGIVPDMIDPNTPANTHLLFFTVYDANTGNVVYSFNQDVVPGAPPTSVFLPGGTLMANTAYVTDLDYSERIDAVDPNTNILTEQGFDQRSEADFTTAPAAVPEASTTVSFGLLLLLGIGSVVIAAKRRRASSAV